MQSSFLAVVLAGVSSSCFSLMFPPSRSDLGGNLRSLVKVFPPVRSRPTSPVDFFLAAFPCYQTCTG